jgi:hypothetical protein
MTSNSFIRATELWLPSADYGVLEYRGGLYPPGSNLARVSQDMCFGRGEGLPGRAWDDGVPIVLKTLSGSYFRRGDAARADSLSCGIALPIFAAERIRAVVVFFCGDDDEHAGAIELWHNDPAQGKDMNLADGYYGRTADIFEYVSRRTSFRPGTGLPGLAWQQHAPVFLPDLGRGSGFMRGDSAVKVGINRGFALPCATPGPDTWVLAFLSALGTPIARRVEIWRPADGGGVLALDAGFCEAQGLLANSGQTLAPGTGCISRCWQDGEPTLAPTLAGEPGVGPQQPGVSAMVAIPVLEQGRFVAAVALYF